MTRRSPNISQQVIETAASGSDTDELALPSLRETLDPDALDTLIRSMSEGQVSFTYVGQRTTVNSRGEIRINK